MKITDKLLSFGLDHDTKTFYITTTDKEYLKLLLSEEKELDTITFELSEDMLAQICKYYSLYKYDKENPEEE